MTENRPKYPLLVDEQVEGRKGNGEQAQQNVGHGQIGDEYVGNGVHLALLEDHVAHQQVAHNAHHKDDQVECVENEVDHTRLVHRPEQVHRMVDEEMRFVAEKHDGRLVQLVPIVPRQHVE